MPSRSPRPGLATPASRSIDDVIRNATLRARRPATAGRAAAIRQPVLDMPTPIVATALGYHHVTTGLAAEAGTIWSSYASGDHRK